MTTGDMTFYAFALMTIVSGVCVVSCRNIVHAGFSLLFTLLGVAGLFGVLGADFLAITQVVVYIGGILVLVLFTVMMTRVPRKGAASRSPMAFIPPAIFSLGLMAVLYKVVVDTDWNAGVLDAPAASTAGIGARFMTDYLFPFEYASLVLLVAMIGAAILIRESKLGKDAQPTSTESEEVQS